jgi:hypothetical protein
LRAIFVDDAHGRRANLSVGPWPGLDGWTSVKWSSRDGLVLRCVRLLLLWPLILHGRFRCELGFVATLFRHIDFLLVAAPRLPSEANTARFPLCDERDCATPVPRTA